MDNPLPLRIDHVVILVNDLAGASAAYSRLGFTVVPGGEHADGLTHNALVPFNDGSYLELIAAKGALPGTHPFARGQKAGEGIIAYALVPLDIGRTITQARERGLELDGPRAGGRLRPDGERLEWQIGTPRTPDLPFLCADVTPRERRVPGGEAREHANRAQGLARVTVAVEGLEASAARYAALLGAEPVEAESTPGSLTFLLGDARLTLVDPSEGAVPHILATRGEGPYSITLRAAQITVSHATQAAREETTISRIHPAEAHGAAIGIIYEKSASQ